MCREKRRRVSRELNEVETSLHVQRKQEKGLPGTQLGRNISACAEKTVNESWHAIGWKKHLCMCREN